MFDYRAVYQKRGEAKYLSHLDTNRCMQRAFKRSGLPVWYSEGFNPHIYLTFALPLALGVESDYEIMDFRLDREMEPKAVEAPLRRALPPGFTLCGIGRPVQKTRQIVSADYQLSVLGQGNFPAAFERFCAQPAVPAIKKTKKGEKELDLKTLFRLKCFAEDESCCQITLNLAAGVDGGCSPQLVFDTFAKQYPDAIYTIERILRTAIYDENHDLFI